MRIVKGQKECSHPPSRLYSWFVNGVPGYEPEKVLIVACCDCGSILKSGSEELEAKS